MSRVRAIPNTIALLPAVALMSALSSAGVAGAAELRFATHTIDSTANQGLFILAADVDGDGDLDVFGAQDTELVWYENTDGAGGFGSAQSISTAVDTPRYLAAADVDGDGDVDLLSAGRDDRKIAWYENTDGAGNFGGQLVLDTMTIYANASQAADVDRDGDLDVVSGGQGGGLGWYENTDGSGGFGPRRRRMWIAMAISTSSASATTPSGTRTTGPEPSTSARKGATSSRTSEESRRRRQTWTAMEMSTS
jgi:hypothetical protein